MPVGLDLKWRVTRADQSEPPPAPQAPHRGPVLDFLAVSGFCYSSSPFLLRLDLLSAIVNSHGESRYSISRPKANPGSLLPTKHAQGTALVRAWVGPQPIQLFSPTTSTDP